MRSALIVYSKSNKALALKIAQGYKDTDFLTVSGQPGTDLLRFKTDKDVVIGIGGGSAIDTAKVISGRKPAITIPSTASGAAITPYATLWKAGGKISVATAKPILKFIPGIAKSLPAETARLTMLDAFAHAIESLWSVNATGPSRRYCARALRMLMSYIKSKDNDLLIKAGNEAGKAIEISKTNVVHASSYPFTSRYGLSHAAACGKLLPYFVQFMDYAKLPYLMGLESTRQVVSLLRKYSRNIIMPDFKPDRLAGMILKYKRIKDGPRRLAKSDLVYILSRVREDSACKKSPKACRAGDGSI
ncbi:MAG: iron-containing alcohol dehydrogenase [Candidatus Omnitrophica bacterium]|nr:iron-containing alcohol dehydrogenase [Candidatus Omnitrophota bacterium]